MSNTKTITLNCHWIATGLSSREVKIAAHAVQLELGAHVKADMGLCTELQPLAVRVCDDLMWDEVVYRESLQRFLKLLRGQKFLPVAHGCSDDQVKQPQGLEVGRATLHQHLQTQRLVLILANPVRVHLENQTDGFSKPEFHSVCVEREVSFHVRYVAVFHHPLPQFHSVDIPIHSPSILGQYCVPAGAWLAPQRWEGLHGVASAGPMLGGQWRSHVNEVCRK